LCPVITAVALQLVFCRDMRNAPLWFLDHQFVTVAVDPDPESSFLAVVARTDTDGVAATLGFVDQRLDDQQRSPQVLLADQKMELPGVMAIIDPAAVLDPGFAGYPDHRVTTSECVGNWDRCWCRRGWGWLLKREQPDNEVTFVPTRMSNAHPGRNLVPVDEGVDGPAPGGPDLPGG